MPPRSPSKRTTARIIRRTKVYSGFKLDIGDQLEKCIKLGVGMFNLLNSHDASDYYCTSRLKVETDKGATGFQVHPLEPHSAHLTAEVQL